MVLVVANLINGRKKRMSAIVSNYVNKKVPVIIIINKEKGTDYHHYS